MLLRLLRERLAVFEIPGLGLEAVFAVIGAAGDEQRHPDALAVGDVTVFDLTVVHGVPFRRRAGWCVCPYYIRGGGCWQDRNPAGHWPAGVKIQLNREQEAAFSPLFPVKNTT